VRRYRNIRRDEHGRSHGWQVSFTRRGQAVGGRFFADLKWGGRARALQSALEYRDRQLLTLYPPVRIRRFAPRNKTGVVGVLLERRRAWGRVRWRYRASWPDGSGGDVRRSFEVSKYGKRRALELAAKARREGVEELERRIRHQVALEVARRRRRGSASVRSGRQRPGRSLTK
jgi:hypothetical protein